MRDNQNVFKKGGTVQDLERHFGLRKGEGFILLQMFSHHTMQIAFEAAEELGPMGQLMLMHPEIGPTMMTEITSGAIDEALRGEENEATMFLDKMAEFIKMQR